MRQMMFACLAACAGLVLMFGSTARAQQLEEYGEASGWLVLIDPSMNYGCLIQAEFQQGELVRIGFDKNQGGGYVSAFHDNWGGIEEGQVYPVLFDLDGQEYEGEGMAVFIDDLPGIQIDFDNMEFFFDIMKKHVMSMYNENGLVMEISLEGTFNAIDFAAECQQEVDAAR